MLGQFTPAHWDKDEWHPTRGPWRFIQVLSLCVVFMAVELNTFFLKFCLWIPPRNPLIVYRLVLWWLIAIPTIREYNTYLQDRYSFVVTWIRFFFKKKASLVQTSQSCFAVISVLGWPISSQHQQFSMLSLLSGDFSTIYRAHMLSLTVYMCLYIGFGFKWLLSTRDG
jgi:hypothetical protein